MFDLNIPRTDKGKSANFYLRHFDVKKCHFRPSWRGYTDWEIQYSEEGSEWQIRSVASSDVVATYNGTSRSVLWPTGLRTWNIVPLSCQPLPLTTTADLILSRWDTLQYLPHDLER